MCQDPKPRTWGSSLHPQRRWTDGGGSAQAVHARAPRGRVLSGRSHDARTRGHDQRPEQERSFQSREESAGPGDNAEPSFPECSLQSTPGSVAKALSDLEEQSKPSSPLGLSFPACRPLLVSVQPGNKPLRSLSQPAQVPPSPFQTQPNPKPLRRPWLGGLLVRLSEQGRGGEGRGEERGRGGDRPSGSAEASGGAGRGPE